MIVTDKKYTVSGSNALSPQEIPSKYLDKNKKRDLEKQRKEHKKIRRQKSIGKKAKILRNIVFSFAIGITLIYRYSLIYNIEKNIIDKKKEIAVINAENENLKIDLLKYNNIKEIENSAMKKLNMIPKSVSSIVYIDLDKNNFKVDSIQGEEKGGTLLKKLKKILF